MKDIIKEEVLEAPNLPFSAEGGVEIGMEDTLKATEALTKLSAFDMHLGTKKYICQVSGCDHQLCTPYAKKYRVCSEHVKSPGVFLHGEVQRFCQKCSRFHSVSYFDGLRRTCRVRLAQHNHRRRQVRAIQRAEKEGTTGRRDIYATRRYNMTDGAEALAALAASASPLETVSPNHSSSDHTTTAISQHNNNQTHYIDHASTSSDNNIFAALLDQTHHHNNNNHNSAQLTMPTPLPPTTSNIDCHPTLIPPPIHTLQPHSSMPYGNQQNQMLSAVSAIVTQCLQILLNYAIQNAMNSAETNRNDDNHALIIKVLEMLVLLEQAGFSLEFMCQNPAIASLLLPLIQLYL